MEKIKPLIRCVDHWPCQIPDDKLAIYKAMIAEEQITKPRVIYNRLSGSTTVEYYSIAPHEWILEQMKGRIMDAKEKLPM